MTKNFVAFVVTVGLVVIVVPPQAEAQGRGRGRGGRGAPPASRPARPVPPPVAIPLVPAIQKAPPGQGSRGVEADLKVGPYMEPAFARGYADAFKLGRDDNRGGK